jgi:transposase
MARYKAYDLNQAKMIPISYSDQIVLGSFEHALSEIVEEHLDLSPFEQRYSNDATGRLAYDPKVLLKIVVYGYYKGIISSRALAEACRRNVVFMALLPIRGRISRRWRASSAGLTARSSGCSVTCCSTPPSSA